jgi:cytochrome c-type biogenesis protein CcmF
LAVIGGSLLLFAIRAQTLNGGENPSPLSRESALLLNNVFLAVAMLTVLMGTVYPLLIDGLGLGKLSVGAPYFNAVFVPLMIPLLILMGLGVHLNWQKDSLKKLSAKLRLVFLMSIFLPILVLLLFTKTIDLYTLLGLTLAFWILLSTLKLIQLRSKQRGFANLGQAFWGMVVAHCGVAATVIGISVSTGYGIQDDVKMAPGDKIKLAGYEVSFISESPLTGANYQGTQTQFRISRGHKQSIIYPEKRIYNVGKMAMTESAIDVNPFRDIYVALGEPIGDKAWSVRVYLKPFVRWIWGGGFMILAGGLLALTDRRYYQLREKNTVNSASQEVKI